MSDPTAEHVDAVARAMCRCHPADDDSLHCSVWRARAVLTSTDPAVHAALLDALVRAGVLTEESPDHSGYGGGLNPALLGVRRLVTEWRGPS